MSTRFGAALGAALLLLGCESLQPEISQSVRDHIARCSGGIGISIGPTLEAEIASDLRSGRLSAGLESKLQGIVFQNARPEDRLPIFSSYVTCIRSEKEFDALIVDVSTKWLGLKQVLDTGEINQPDIDRLADLHGREIDALKNRRLGEAREHRKAILITLARMDDPNLAISWGKSKPAAQGPLAQSEVFALLSRANGNACNLIFDENEYCQTLKVSSEIP